MKYKGNWNSAVKTFLAEYTGAAIKNLNDEEKTQYMIMAIIESDHVISKIREHRPDYDIYDCVVKMGTKYLHYEWYRIKTFVPWKDDPWDIYNLNFDLDCVYFVEPFTQPA